MSQARGPTADSDFTRQDLEAILDSLAEGIVTLDGQRRVTGINRAACEILEVQRSDALQTDCRGLFGEQFCSQAAAVRESIEKCQPVENVLTRVRTPSGRKKVLSIRTNVLRGEDDRPRGSVVVFRDVTGLVATPRHAAESDNMAAESAVPAADGSPPKDEQDITRRTLESTGWNVAKAARRLRISRTTLYERIRRYGLARPKE